MPAPRTRSRGVAYVGVQNLQEVATQYPAHLTFHTRRITHRCDLVVVENLISYNGALWM